MPVPIFRSPARKPSYTMINYMYNAECLGQSHGDSLVVSSVSVGSTTFFLQLCELMSHLFTYFQNSSLKVFWGIGARFNLGTT